MTAVAGEHPHRRDLPLTRAGQTVTGQSRTVRNRFRCHPGELLYGVARLPDGHRKATLTAAVHALINEDFHGRVVPFDVLAAAMYAPVVCDREKLGRPICAADAQVAAICRARRATLATRNTKDFADTGIELVNPWHVR